MSSESTPQATEDNFIWLEEIKGEVAVDWANQQSLQTRREFADSERFEAIRDDVLECLNSPTQIPMVVKCREYFYNFWQDEKTRVGCCAARVLNLIVATRPNGKPYSTSMRSAKKRAWTGFITAFSPWLRIMRAACCISRQTAAMLRPFANSISLRSVLSKTVLTCRRRKAA